MSYRKVVVPVAKLASTTVYPKAPQPGPEFNTPIGITGGKKLSYLGYPGRPSLTWLPGKSTRESDGSRLNTDHITHLVPISL